MKHKLLRTISLLWILVLVLCTVVVLLIDVPATKSGDLEGFQNLLDTSIPNYMDKHHIAGTAVGLIHDGKVVYLKGYGYASFEKDIPITENTVFQVASISKAMTAWGIMNLVEQGILELDQPVSSYLTRWELPPSKYDPNGVTLRRVLSHSSGLAHVGGYAGFSSDELKQSLEESLTSASDANGEGVRIVSEPGTRYSYSGGGYTLLQLVIEEVTGLPFDEYMKNEILEPLGMHQSSFASDPAMVENLSVVYDTGGNAVPCRSFTAKAAAGLYTTAHDLSLWAAAMIPANVNSEGMEILTADTLQQMYRPQIEKNNLFPYGLGYMIQNILFKDEIEVSHTGTNLPGWSSLVATVPTRGEGIVILTNSPGGNALRHEIHSSWLYWVTGGSTAALKLQKLVNILKVVLPVGLSGGLALLITGKILKKSRKSSKE